MDDSHAKETAPNLSPYGRRKEQPEPERRTLRRVLVWSGVIFGVPFWLSMGLIPGSKSALGGMNSDGLLVVQSTLVLLMLISLSVAPRAYRKLRGGKTRIDNAGLIHSLISSFSIFVVPFALGLAR